MAVAGSVYTDTVAGSVAPTAGSPATDTVSASVEPSAGSLVTDTVGADIVPVSGPTITDTVGFYIIDWSGPTGGTVPPPEPVRFFAGAVAGRTVVASAQVFGGPTEESALIGPTSLFGGVTSGTIEFDFLTPPIKLIATPVATSKISLSWTDTTLDEDGFRIERSPNGRGEWSSIGTVGANVSIFVDLNATPLVVYDYRVIAFRAVIESAPSNVVSAYSPAPGQPAPPPSTGTLRIRTLDYLSPGVYGVERDLDGNTGGAKI